MLDPRGSSPTVKVVARPHKGAGGVAAPTKDKTSQLTDPLLSMDTRPNVVPAAGQRSGEAVAQRAAVLQKGSGGATGLLGEWVGPSIAKFLTTGHASTGGVALDALGLLPISRGPRAILEGLRAAHAAEGGARATEAARAAQESYQAGKGLVAPVAKKVGGYVPRALKVNEFEQQLPKARSRIAQVGERAVDRVSSKLQASVLARDTPGVRILTAGERVAKAAGRSQRLERSRRQAQMFDQLHAIGAIKEGSPEDVGNFWYAQLPSTHRNAEGLSLIRDKQAEELQYITSGKALEDLGQREAAVKAQMSAAATNGEALKHLTELQDIKTLMTDLEHRPTDIAASIGQLDKVIAEPPVVNEAAIQAVHGLANDRERVLVGSGRLKADRAAGRKGLVANWLGLDAMPSEAHLAENPRDRFVPVIYHHDGKVSVGSPGGDHASTPGALGDGVQGYAVIENGQVVKANFSPAIGADREIAPEELAHYADTYDKNPQIQAEVKQAVESKLHNPDELAYLGHRLPKPESFKGSFMPSGGTGRVASPQGLGRENKLVLAKTGRLRQSLRVAAEDWSSAQVFEQANIARDDLAGLGTTFQGHVPAGRVLVNPKGRTVPPYWKTDELSQFHGDYEDIQQIREHAKEVLDGFVATDRSGFERMKQEALDSGVSWDELRVVPKRYLDRYYGQFRASSSRGKGAKVYDAAVDAVATSIVFARIGYIPKNFAQNLIMAVPHQGAFLLVNAVRAGQVMADPQLRHLMHAEIGFTGATGALGKEAMTQKILGAAASAVSKVADDPMRIAAFLHEAAAEGVISKVRPLLTDKDRQALVRLLSSKSERTRLNDIRWRSVEAMADFSRMTPDQARIARRFLIIPGWLMAGSRYPFHFAATHPIRSALLAYVAMGEPGSPDSLHFNQPIDQYFTGSSYRRGIETPWGRVRTGSLSPANTPWDLGVAAVQTARGKQGPFDFAHETAFDYAQPLAAAGVNIAQGKGVAKSLERLVPNKALVEGLVHPAASDTYPEDKTRLGRLKRELGVVPIKIKDPAAKKTSADRERERLASVSKAFGSVPVEVASAEHTRTLYQDAEKALKKEHGVKGLSDREQVKLKLQIIEATHPELVSAVDQLRSTVDENTDPEVFHAVSRWAEKQLGWAVADKFETAAKKLKKAQHG